MQQLLIFVTNPASETEPTSDVWSPLTPDDTADYIRSRLKQSGCDRELVTADALAMLHEAAAGSLRDLDRLATAALRDAARRKRKLVERDAITRVVDTEPREAA